MAGIRTRTLLLVDDEPAQVRLVTAMAARAGWRTIAVPDGRKAIGLIADRLEPVDAVLIDVWRPAESGAALVRDIRARWPQLPIVMLTAQPSIALAVEAMRAGASDFLIKPIAPDRLFAALEGASFADQAEGELRPLAEKTIESLGFDEIVGSAPAFRTAMAVAAKAARSRLPVLIEGEAGSGKELIARAIHAASARGRRQPVLVECAALSPTHAESEIFGHERDAFAGAFQSSPGRIAYAEGGTLILGEPATLSDAAQARLLTLLEDGLVTPVGGRNARCVDVRVIALAERPLSQAVAAGRLRPELAERLATIQIRVPSLRQRAGDVPALARHLLSRISRKPGMRGLGLTDEALALLTTHSWPGNVRQLHDALFRAALDAEGDVLTIADFPQVARAATVTADAAVPLAIAGGIELYERDGHIRRLEAIEADIIRLAIGHYEGRMSEVARRLGIGRSTLYRKLVELGLDSAA
ncbi:sigma-54-dependent transcriptional regulator [Sphingomonas quercus]|uniref:DNA-binding transcriptional regulator NtrC n=1 Tax=Sphingomonas quercus TaxID=2842451 RepID=A0ABS6BDV1_9SPHN|nr:sigma-54 dependent transcriptional regulator [Sphingomonas quercus]MBU3076501.1 sigma-54 dependent transcriptional regulator [Sphingomonas quercus]